jgi:hypothetical protein
MSHASAILHGDKAFDAWSMRVISATGIEIKRWVPGDFLEGSAGSRAECRFSPTCTAFVGCPDLPAEYSEGGCSSHDPRHVASPSRYVAICRPRAVVRHGRRAIDALAVLDVLDAKLER